MVIKKRLNNNVVVVEDHGKEKILMGCGLAFHKQVGESVDIVDAEKVFNLEDDSLNERFQELLTNMPLEHIEVSDKIIAYAMDKLKKKLNENIYISLSDHISMSVYRANKGILVSNALLWEIKKFYATEYQIGIHALDIINAELGVKLPEDEAGFIAMHFVNALMETNVGVSNKTTKLIAGIVNIVKYTFHIQFDENSVFYGRFITHLKFFAQRIFKEDVIEVTTNVELLEMLKLQYKKEYQCVQKMERYIQREYGYELSDDEKLYLTIHTARIVDESSK